MEDFEFDFSGLKQLEIPEEWQKNALKIPNRKYKPRFGILKNPLLLSGAASVVLMTLIGLTVFFSVFNNSPVRSKPAEAEPKTLTATAGTSPMPTAPSSAIPATGLTANAAELASQPVTAAAPSSPNSTNSYPNSASSSPNATEADGEGSAPTAAAPEPYVQSSTKVQSSTAPETQKITEAASTPQPLTQPQTQPKSVPSTVPVSVPSTVPVTVPATENPWTLPTEAPWIAPTDEPQTEPVDDIFAGKIYLLFPREKYDGDVELTVFDSGGNAYRVYESSRTLTRSGKIKAEFYPRGDGIEIPCGSLRAVFYNDDGEAICDKTFYAPPSARGTVTILNFTALD